MISEPVSWDRDGLEAIVLKACRYFEGVTGHALPYNQHCYGPWGDVDYGCRKYDNLECVEQAARFTGWLYKAAHIPELVRFISKTTSYRGVNSPRTPAKLGVIAQKHPSPQRFARWLRSVRRRAAMILQPWGLYPSWYGLAIAASDGSRRVGKAALCVARHTIERTADNLCKREERKISHREYLIRARGLRKWRTCTPYEREAVVWTVYDGLARDLNEGIELVKASLFRHMDDTGTIAYCLRCSEEVDGDVRVYPAWDENAKFFWLFLRDDGRSWRAQIGWRHPETWDYLLLRRGWFEQDLAKGIVDLREPADRCWLISLDDFRQATNTQYELQQTREQVGLVDRAYVGVQHMLPYKGIKGVAQVLAYVAAWMATNK